MKPWNLRQFRFPWRTSLQRDAEVNAELQFHVDMRMEELRARGMTELEARAEALRQFGSVDGAREYCQDQDRRADRAIRVGDLLQEAGQDTRFALRFLRRRPGFAAAVSLTLAIAIVAVTSAFSLMDAYLLRPLPFPDPHQLVWVLAGPDRQGNVPVPAGFREVDWNGLNDLFAETVVWDLDGFTLTGGVRSEYVDGAWVSAGFLTSLGKRTEIGRLFTPDEIANRAPVALISYDLWVRRFNRSPDVIGRTLAGYSTDRPLTPIAPEIVGVLASDTWHLNRFTSVLMPLAENRLPSMGRLRPGMDLEEAQRRLNDLVLPQVGAADPRWHMSLVSVQDEYSYQVRPVLRLLFAAALALMLIAGANVAGLLVASGSRRTREIAIRGALGAGKGRLARQLMTEGLVLAALSAGLALLP